MIIQEAMDLLQMNNHLNTFYLTGDTKFVLQIWLRYANEIT